MLTTVRKGVDRLSTALLLTAVFTLTLGSGVFYTLLIIMGECAGGGSSGCAI